MRKIHLQGVVRVDKIGSDSSCVWRRSVVRLVGFPETRAEAKVKVPGRVRQVAGLLLLLVLLRLLLSWSVELLLLLVHHNGLRLPLRLLRLRRKRLERV